MQAAARPYVLASAALLATNMVVATPLVARQLTPLGLARHHLGARDFDHGN